MKIDAFEYYGCITYFIGISTRNKWYPAQVKVLQAAGQNI